MFIYVIDNISMSLKTYNFRDKRRDNMTCDRCKQEFVEPSSNQHIDMEIIFYTPDGKEIFLLCPECQNKLYNWLYQGE